MNELIPREPMFAKPHEDGGHKRPLGAALPHTPPSVRGWSVAIMVMGASQGLQRLLASSGDSSIENP